MQVEYSGPSMVPRHVPNIEAFENRSNLPYVTQPGYNYNRKRKKGEGDDWDELNG